MFFWITIISILLFDAYVFFSLRKMYSGRGKKIFYGIYITTWLFFVLTLILVFIFFGTRHLASSSWFAFVMGTSFVFSLTKIVVGFFLIGEDLFRFFKFMFLSVRQKKMSKENMDSRRKFVATIAYGTAAIPFFSLMYGILYGKYDFKIHRQKLKSSRVPKSFDGFKIVQLSDMHIGSFDNKDSVQKGFDMVNDLNPDLILFTGDMVNNLADEVEGYEEMLSGLKAKYGKFSVLGNHDYGEYIRWDSDEDKQANIDRLIQLEESCGFKMLHNENAQVEINGEKIDILGVQNWGNNPFPQYGDLDEALQGTESNSFKVLLSHDPDHFEEKVIDHDQFIDLTLSGHTHGSQMGVEIPGFRWSPVQYRYKRWAGRYEENGQVLYVNRGFGYIGYPGRVGIWPEITAITLELA